MEQILQILSSNEARWIVLILVAIVVSVGLYYCSFPYWIVRVDPKGKYKDTICRFKRLDKALHKLYKLNQKKSRFIYELHYDDGIDEGIIAE